VRKDEPREEETGFIPRHKILTLQASSGVTKNRNVSAENFENSIALQRTKKPDLGCFAVNNIVAFDDRRNANRLGRVLILLIQANPCARTKTSVPRVISAGKASVKSTSVPGARSFCMVK
jgi:hypothetical protein